MKVVTKLGIITLTALTIAPLTMATVPTAASAKTYKISKNVLNNKTRCMAKNVAGGIMIRQKLNKHIEINRMAGMYTRTLEYKIISQKVKGNKLTLKLDSRKVKSSYFKDYGTLVLIRTGKTTYRIPKIYVGSKTGEYHLNGRNYHSNDAQNVVFNKTKQISINGLKMTKHKSLVKTDSVLDYMFKHEK